MRKAVCGLLLAAGCAASPPPPSYFVDLEHRWIDALQAHDTGTLDRLLDDTFIDSTFRGGVRTKHDVLSGPPPGAPYRSIRLEDVVVRPYGGQTVVVTGINVLRGESETDVVRVRFTDVFVGRHGHWRAVSAQETLQAGP